jgi:quinoprotein glucose dehydrogenase
MNSGDLTRVTGFAGFWRAACLVVLPTVAAGQDDSTLVEWPVYGGSLASQFYSPLDQIDADNVGDLRIAWRWYGGNFGPRPEIKSETTPLMIDGVLYATAGITRNVAAIDARSGETLWLWRPNEGERFDNAPRKISGRGVAYWADGDDERILTVTPGFHLVALDADTGLPVREFGEAGVMFLALKPEARPGKRDFKPPVDSTNP